MQEISNAIYQRTEIAKLANETAVGRLSSNAADINRYTWHLEPKVTIGDSYRDSHSQRLERNA